MEAMGLTLAPGSTHKASPPAADQTHPYTFKNNAKTENMNQQFTHKQRVLGFWYGFVAGIAFSAMAWGLDALLLATSNGGLPWIRFIPGMVICTLLSTLVGWWTMRADNHLVGFFLWLALAVPFAWLVIWLPLTSTPYLLKIFDPTLYNFINYTTVDQAGQFNIVGGAVIGLVSVICGLLEINLINMVMQSTGTATRFIPLLVCAVMFGLAGLTTDNLINENLRKPVQNIDELIQFAADNVGKELSPEVYRQKRMSVVAPLTDLLQLPRRLTVISHDRYLGQIEVMVDFDGVLVTCTSVYNQPTYCKRVPTPGTKLFQYADTHRVKFNLN